MKKLLSVVVIGAVIAMQGIDASKDESNVPESWRGVLPDMGLFGDSSVPEEFYRDSGALHQRLNATSQSVTSPKKKYYSWKQMHVLGYKVAKILQQKKAAGEVALQAPLKGIISVTCGGLDPASFVVQAFKNMPGMLCENYIVDTVCMRSYGEDNKQRSIQILKKPTLEHFGREWLIVDDLVDTGNSFKRLLTIYPNAIYAVLLAKPAGMPYVDVFAEEVPQDTWVVFPWEREPKHKTARKDAVSSPAPTKKSADNYKHFPFE